MNTPSSTPSIRPAWTAALLVLGLLLPGRGESLDIRLAGPDRPLRLDGFLHSEHSWVVSEGNLALLGSGLPGWDEGYRHDVQGSLLLGGNLSRNLGLNGTLLYDSRYGRNPHPAWDRRYWNHLRLGLSLDTERPFWGTWELTGRLRTRTRSGRPVDLPEARLLREPVDPLRLEALLTLTGPGARFRLGDGQRSLGPGDLVLHERSLFGLDGRLTGTSASVEVLGARTRGDVFLQSPVDSLGIRADGTSGPYRLARSPVVRGSERVWVEVRDRFDPSQTRERRAQRRGMDYTIDYVRGEIVFLEPVASETFDDHPVFIAVQYAHGSEREDFESYLGALRGRAGLTEDIVLGATYAGEFERAGSWAGPASRPAPATRHAYALDGTYDRSGTRFEAAVARSDRDGFARGSNQTALALGLTSTAGELMRVEGGYRRIEAGFQPLGNRFLNDERNRERWKLGATLLPESPLSFQLHGRSSRDLDPGTPAPLTDRSILAGADWRSGTLRVGASHEARETFNRNHRDERDDLRRTTRLSATRLGRRLEVVARYEFERLDTDSTGTETRESIHRFKLAPILNLGKGVRVGGEAKSELVQDRAVRRFRDRRSFLRGRFDARLGKSVSTLVTVEHRTETALDETRLRFRGGEAIRSATGASWGVNLLPHPSWETLLRLEGSRERDEGTGRNRRMSWGVRQQLYYRPNPGFQIREELSITDLQDPAKVGLPGDARRRREHELRLAFTANRGTSLALAWGVHGRRGSRLAPDELLSWALLGYLNGTVHLSTRVELTIEGEFRWTGGEPLDLMLPEIPVENTRLRILGELALDLTSGARLALGHERQEYRDYARLSTDHDYDAGRSYFKLMGRF